MPQYDLLKSVSIKSLEEAGACERELHRFTFLMARTFPHNGVCFYDQEFPVSQAVLIASYCHDTNGTGVDWLLRNGFIKEKEPELLPCPFCGPGNSVVELYQDDILKWRIACGRCGLHSGIHPHNSKEEIIKHWNTRV